MIAWVLRLAHRAVVLGECGLPEPGLPANTGGLWLIAAAVWSEDG